METWDAIRARRNVREFDGREIEEHALERILEAGRRSPSAHNRQQWDLVVITDDDALAELSGVWPGAAWIPGSAATIAIVTPDQEDEAATLTARFDLGQMTMMMMLAAADCGVGSGHAHCKDQALARKVLGFPEDHSCIALVGMGYPSAGPLAPLNKIDRRPLDDVVHRGGWRAKRPGDIDNTKETT